MGDIALKPMQPFPWNRWQGGSIDLPREGSLQTKESQKWGEGPHVKSSKNTTRPSLPTNKPSFIVCVQRHASATRFGRRNGPPEMVRVCQPTFLNRLSANKTPSTGNQSERAQALVTAAVLARSRSGSCGKIRELLNRQKRTRVLDCGFTARPPKGSMGEPPTRGFHAFPRARALRCAMEPCRASQTLTRPGAVAFGPPTLDPTDVLTDLVTDCDGP